MPAASRRGSPASTSRTSTFRPAATFPIAAAHARGLEPLLAALQPALGTPEEAAAADEAGGVGIRVAIIGRPNVGKSTLVNRLLGEERVVVSEVAGTTRDAIEVPLERDGRRDVLIDTAGLRRRGKVEEALEKFASSRSSPGPWSCSFPRSTDRGCGN